MFRDFGSTIANEAIIFLLSINYFSKLVLCYIFFSDPDLSKIFLSQKVGGGP
jgi:hypothetical protein